MRNIINGRKNTTKNCSLHMQILPTIDYLFLEYITHNFGLLLKLDAKLVQWTHQLR